MTRGAAAVGFRLYLITDRCQTGGRDFLAVVEEALAGGISAVQLREKGIPSAEYFELAREMRTLTARYGAKLLVNDRVDIALAVAADGVHLPESGLPIRTVRELTGPANLIGVSCHSLAKARDAERQGADFITFGPVYATPSKVSYGDPLGVGVLAEVVRSVDLPVFALGGVSRDRIPDLLAAGAAGAALISAVLSAPDPRTSAKDILSLLDVST